MNSNCTIFHSQLHYLSLSTNSNIMCEIIFYIKICNISLHHVISFLKIIKNIKSNPDKKKHGLTCCLEQRPLKGGKCLCSVIPETCLFDLTVTCPILFSYVNSNFLKSSSNKKKRVRKKVRERKSM